MAFTARTDHKESLQTLAMAMRQENGEDLTDIELAKAMKDLNDIPSKIKNNCVIDYSKMKSDFNSWVPRVLKIGLIPLFGLQMHLFQSIVRLVGISFIDKILFLDLKELL